MAQRLVRRVCSECQTEFEPDPMELGSLGLDPETYGGRGFKRGRGCRACEGTGYRGRVALYERLEMDHTLRDMTFRGTALEDLRNTALSTGAMTSLLADGARKVVEGLTTTQEVLRVTRGKK